MAMRTYGRRGIPLVAVGLAIVMWMSGCSDKQEAAPAPAGSPPPAAAEAPPEAVAPPAAAPQSSAREATRPLPESRPRAQGEVATAPPPPPRRMPEPEQERAAEMRRRESATAERSRESAAARIESRRGAPTAAPPLPREAPADALAAVDRAMASLTNANIAFNAPRKMNLDNTVEIQLLLSVRDSVAALKEAVTAAGDKETAQVKVSSRMEARLTGANFSITAISPEEQAITRSGTTEWKWEVKPASVGSHRLHLTLTALFDVERSGLVRRGIKTFDQTIDVQVTWGQQLTSFVKENWQWLWAALLVPAAGWAWNRRRK